MQARRYLRLTWLLLGLGLAACAGGSGSSGFDENAAIQQALGAQRCVAGETLTICPAGRVPLAPTPTATPGGQPTVTPGAGTPTATPPPGVKAGGVDPTGVITCVPSLFSAACSFTLPFTPQGLPPTTVFRVAVRLDANGRWMIEQQPPVFSPHTPSGFDAPVTIETQTAAPDTGTAIQIAILAFLVEPTAVVPSEVNELADSGADFAFVTPEVILRPEAVGAD